MPRFKCSDCRIRLDGQGGNEVCPGCGNVLEAVGQLSELVGFKAVSCEPSAGQRRLTARIDEVRASARAGGPAPEDDAERWLDDGGSVPEAMANAVALPPLELDA